MNHIALAVKVFMTILAVGIIWTHFGPSIQEVRRDYHTYKSEALFLYGTENGHNECKTGFKIRFDWYTLRLHSYLYPVDDTCKEIKE